MEFGGVTPLDAPDPSLASEARLRACAFPIIELKPQPSIARTPITGFTESRGSAGLFESSVRFSYTLWRYPEDRSDPRNEVELDERTRRSIDEEPPWGRPDWLREQARLFHYPILWEAVRTSWYGSAEHPTGTVPLQMVDHVNHVLRNSFREQLGLPAGPGGGDEWKASVSAVVPSTVVVDGEAREGVRIDTDPWVSAVGFPVSERVLCTAVVARDALPFVDLELSTFRV
ncbi:hypothetical protein GCM10010988_20720 [Cnuibacter physcomitrellae]|uniref:Uncharacterized protein n=1 Tax=Cnuibacter physcomitrellae TaxID=1619308 RepID=A0A1X9LNK5_9MICO|nr:hypothetical protein [Cnuibacter physcomitrellae]ARJ06763.1 hypothetical protein B5808_17180 [Cnuibacter physcomitrellae]GGI38768.1 hypothetical protein GCM10010988_20720 [Cnuibacter physcomitrellae]